MRLLHTLILLIVYILPIFSQIEDGTTVSHNKEFAPCVIYDMDTTGATAARIKLKQVQYRNRSLRESCGFDVSKMPLSILYVYDVKVLEDLNLTVEEWESLVLLQSYQRLIKSHDCAGVEYGGFKVTFKPITVQEEYSSLNDVMNMLSLPSGSLHWLIDYKEDNDLHLLQFFSKMEVSQKGIGTQMTLSGFSPSKAKSVINPNMLMINANTACHEFGHCLGGDHEDPNASPVTPAYARAYVTPNGHTPLKYTNIISNQIDCWSGPNSSFVYNNDTIPLSDGFADNASVIQTIMDMLRDVVDRTMVQTSGGECGSGTIQACTNNADIWSWEVLSGDVALLSDLNQPSMEYIAYEPSTIRVIGQMTGKLYADTLTIDLPGIESEARDTSVYVGSSLPDGQIVLFPGSYEVILPGEGSNGCDLLVNYNVDLIAAFDDQQQDLVQLVPNPTTGKVTITNLDEIQEVKVYSITGSLMSTQYKKNMVDLSDLPPGTYLIQVISERGICQGKVMKH